MQYNLPNDLELGRIIATSTNSLTTEYIGYEGGKECFGYVRSSSPPSRALADAIIDQLRGIHGIARAFQLVIPHELLFLDICSSEFSTLRSGLKRLRIAARSALFDCRTIIAQSADRIARQPDEYEFLRSEFDSLGISMLFYTSMPAASFSDVERYFQNGTVGTGFLG